MMKREITLAMETAVEGGSLSLLEGNTIIDRWAGEKEVSRSEQLLKAISGFLEKNRIKPGDLGALAVSRGPGSYTGARIGLATANGIKNGLNIRCNGVSILSAFCQLENTQLDIICAISFGKDEVCWQVCEKSQNGNGTAANLPRVNSPMDFKEIISRKTEATIIINNKLHHQIENLLTDNSYRIINAGSELSDYIGIAAVAANYNESDNLKPIYPVYCSTKDI